VKEYYKAAWLILDVSLGQNPVAERRAKVKPGFSFAHVTFAI
jgi:hypothetical protein